MTATQKLIIACAFAVTGNTLFAQAAEPVELRNVVQLASSGSVEVQQDVLALTLGTSKEGADPAAVQSQLRQALDSALAEARRSALTGEMDVRTGAFGLQPRYSREGKINGWTGSTELVLEGRDFARIGAAAGKIQSLTIRNVAFSLSPDLRNKAETQAQDMAIDRFKLKAADIAHRFGFAGYSLRDVSVSASDQGFMPRPRALSMEMKTMAADVAVPMEAGKSAVVVNVNGSVQLK